MNCVKYGYLKIKLHNMCIGLYECECLLHIPINQITQTSLSINFNYSQ